VVGAAAVIQSYFKSTQNSNVANHVTLNSYAMRALLKNTGTAQGAGNNIGPLPNLQNALNPANLPVSDIKANNSDGPYSVNNTTTVTLTADLDGGQLYGAKADLWAMAYVVQTGKSFYLTPYGQWTSSAVPVYQGIMATIDPPRTIFSGKVPPGLLSYRFYWGIDFLMDAVPTEYGITPSFRDYVQVNSTVSSGPLQFIDVPLSPYKYWAYDHIMAEATKGVITGCGSGFFCTGDYVTRAWAAEYIIKAKYAANTNFTYTAAPAWFIDVPLGHAQYKYVQKMKDDGITSGCGGGYYCEASNMKRKEMAVFIVKALNQTGSGVQPISYYFDDLGGNDGYAPWINRLKELGVTSGCATRAFCPEDHVRKDQMSVFMKNAWPN